MRQILKILTLFLGIIGVCAASLTCFILIYPLFHGDFSPREEDTSAENPPQVQEEASPLEDGAPANADAAPETAGRPSEENREEDVSPADGDVEAELILAGEASGAEVALSDARDAESGNHKAGESGAVEMPSPTPTPEKNIPVEYQSALNRAGNYSDLMHMSKEAIYDQLISEYGENVSPEAARYAVDHVEADWKENALQKAKVYSDTMYMSKTGIYDQLVSETGEKFTRMEAQYAMDSLEANWKENALKKAKEYRKSSNMTNSAIYDQLISDHGDKFTPEEATYAIKNLK